MRWSEAGLSARRKGEPGKVRSARELRSKTTTPYASPSARAAPIPRKNQPASPQD